MGFCQFVKQLVVRLFVFKKQGWRQTQFRHDPLFSQEMLVNQCRVARKALVKCTAPSRIMRKRVELQHGAMQRSMLIIKFRVTKDKRGIHSMWLTGKR